MISDSVITSNDITGMRAGSLALSLSWSHGAQKGRRHVSIIICGNRENVVSAVRAELVLETQQPGQPLSVSAIAVRGDVLFASGQGLDGINRAGAPGVVQFIQSGEQISIKALGSGSRAPLVPRCRLLGTRLVWKQTR
jgi:hypothetical protein